MNKKQKSLEFIKQIKPNGGPGIRYFVDLFNPKGKGYAQKNRALVIDDEDIPLMLKYIDSGWHITSLREYTLGGSDKTKNTLDDILMQIDQLLVMFDDVLESIDADQKAATRWDASLGNLSMSIETSHDELKFIRSRIGYDSFKNRYIEFKDC